MKTKIMTLTAIVIGLALCSCSGRFDVKQLDNGYYHFKTKVDKNVVRWTLMLRHDEKERIITEALVVSNQVLTILPTVGEWGRWQTWEGGITLDTSPMMQLNLDTDGRIHFGGMTTIIDTGDTRETLIRLFTAFKTNNIINPGTWSILIQTPNELQRVIQISEEVAPYAGQYGMFFDIWRRSNSDLDRIEPSSAGDSRNPAVSRTPEK